MNILTFTSLFPNAERPNHGVFVWQRMARFASLGHNVKVAAPVPYCPGWLRHTAWEQYSRIPEQELVGSLSVYHPRYPLVPKISMPAQGLSMYLGSLRLVRRLHQAVGFDCIDAHYVYPDGLAAIMLGRAMDVPVFVSARGSDINVFSTFASIRPMIQYTLRHASGVIAVSKALRDRMVGLGCCPDKTSVIGNGVDTDRFAPMDRAECRSRLNIPQDAEAIVSVAALIESKGHHTTIAALARLLPQHPRLRLYLVGDGPRRSRLAQFAAKHRISDRVIFAGPVPNEQLRDWYSAADASCLFSAREGWPNVVLESLACGTPIVATSVGGIPEIILDNKLGTLVDGSVDSVASGLHGALQRKWDRKALVDYATGHSWNAVAGTVQQFFLKTLTLSRCAASPCARNTTCRTRKKMND